MSHKAKLIPWLAMIGAVLACGIFVYSPDAARLFFLRFAYPFFITLFLSVPLVVFKVWGHKFGRMQTRDYHPLLVGLGLTLIMAISVGYELRVLSDEANLISVSQSLYLQHTPYNIITGINSNFAFFPDHQIVPKRPLVFATGTALLHYVLGYSYKNAFVLNFILCTALITLVFQMVRSRIHSFPLALAIVCLLLTNPLFVASATSAGFEILFIFLFFTSLVTAWTYLRTPSQEMLWVHVISLTLLVNSRYEAIVLAAPIFLMIVGRTVRNRHLSPYMMLTLLLGVTVLFAQIRLTYTQQQTGAGVDAFSLAHIWPNFKSTFRTYFLNSGYVVFPYWLNWLSVLGVIGVTILGTNKLDRRSKQFVLLAVSVVVLHLIFVFSYHSGSMKVTSSARYFVLVSMIGSISTAGVLLFLPLKGREFYKVAALLLVVCFSTYPAMSQKLSRSLTEYRKLTKVYRHLDQYNSDEVLVISARPNNFVIREFSSFGFRALELKRDVFAQRLKMRTYKKILVVQDVNPETGEIFNGQSIPAQAILEKVEELGIDRRRFVRISQLVGI